MISAERVFCKEPGNGTEFTVQGLLSSLKKWVLPATGAEPALRLMKVALRLLKRFLSDFMKKDLYTEVSG